MNKTVAKVILWDLDGTIIDSVGIFEAVLAAILPKHDCALPTHEAVTSNFHGSLEETIGNTLEPMEPEKFAAIVKDFLVEQDTHYDIIEPHIFPDALRLVERAHAAGYRQILVTNREHTGRLRASPRNIVANSDLSKYIDLVVAGDDSEHRKPKPEVLGTVLDELEGAHVLVIGDQFVDGQFALNLDAKGILVAHDGHPPNLDQLDDDWEAHVEIVQSLDDIKLE